MATGPWNVPHRLEGSVGRRSSSRPWQSCLPRNPRSSLCPRCPSFPSGALSSHRLRGARFLLQAPCECGGWGWGGGEGPAFLGGLMGVGCPAQWLHCLAWSQRCGGSGTSPTGTAAEKLEAFLCGPLCFLVAASVDCFLQASVESPEASVFCTDGVSPCPGDSASQCRRPGGLNAAPSLLLQGETSTDRQRACPTAHTAAVSVSWSQADQSLYPSSVT